MPGEYGVLSAGQTESVFSSFPKSALGFGRGHFLCKKDFGILHNACFFSGLMVYHEGEEDTNMNLFPERLTQLRTNRQLRQRELAKSLHVSTSAISNYEQRLRYPDIDMLIRIADYFGVTTDYLLGRTERMEAK